MFIRPPSHHLAHGFRNLDNAYHYSMVERAQRLARRVLGEGWPARGALPAKRCQRCVPCCRSAVVQQLKSGKAPQPERRLRTPQLGE